MPCAGTSSCTTEFFNNFVAYLFPLREARGGASPVEGDVFFPREFFDLSDEDQVLRTLPELVKAKQLVRLGYGAYARAITSHRANKALETPS